MSAFEFDYVSGILTLGHLSMKVPPSSGEDDFFQTMLVSQDKLATALLHEFREMSQDRPDANLD